MDLTKLKPFDRKAAKEGKQVVNGAGRKALYYFDSGLDVKYPIAVWWEGDMAPCYYPADGDDGAGLQLLFMAPDVREYWAFKYRYEFGKQILLSSGFISLDAAKEGISALPFHYKIIGEPFCYHTEEI